MRALRVVAEADCKEDQASFTLRPIFCSGFLNHRLHSESVCRPGSAPGVLASTVSECLQVSLFLGYGLELKMLSGGLEWLRAGRLQAVLLRSTVTAPAEVFHFVAELQLAYRVVTLRAGHDLLLVRRGSFLDTLLR